MSSDDKLSDISFTPMIQFCERESNEKDILGPIVEDVPGPIVEDVPGPIV